MITKKEMEEKRTADLNNKITIAKNKAKAILERTEQGMLRNPETGRVLVCKTDDSFDMSSGVLNTHPWFHVMESLTTAGFEPKIQKVEPSGSTPFHQKAGWKIEVEW